jgi:hypothetical protein
MYGSTMKGQWRKIEGGMERKGKRVKGALEGIAVIIVNRKSHTKPSTVGSI